MLDNDEKIKNILGNTFDNYNAEVNANDWVNINSNIDKVNFYRFSIYKFNVYFLSSIVLTTVTSLVVAFSYINYKNSNYNNYNNSISLPQQTQMVTIIDTTFVTDTLNKNNVNKIKYSGTKRNPKLNTTILKTGIGNEISKLETKKSDSLKISLPLFIKTNSNSINIDDSLNMALQKITVVKRKNVIVRDTVYVNKKKYKTNLPDDDY